MELNEKILRFAKENVVANTVHRLNCVNDEIEQ